MDEHQKQFIKLIRENSYRHRVHEVFTDFCELAALSISNSVDQKQYQVREERYMKIVQRYSKEEIARFPQMLACVVESLEMGMADCLGELFMALELGSAFKGQFFTPYSVGLMMAQMTISDMYPTLEQRGYVTVLDPAAGAGCMLIAQAEAIQGLNCSYQRSMHATAVDIDLTAVHMAYIQLSLLYIPAVVFHGNSLSCEYWSHWVTPAHVLGFWDRKLDAPAAGDQDQDDTKTIVPDSMPSTIKAHAVRAARTAANDGQLSLFG